MKATKTVTLKATVGTAGVITLVSKKGRLLEGCWGRSEDELRAEVARIYGGKVKVKPLATAVRAAAERKWERAVAAAAIAKA